MFEQTILSNWRKMLLVVKRESFVETFSLLDVAVVLLFVRFSPSIYLWGAEIPFDECFVTYYFAQPLKVVFAIWWYPNRRNPPSMHIPVLSGDVLVLISPRRKHPAWASTSMSSLLKVDIGEWGAENRSSFVYHHYYYEKGAGYMPQQYSTVQVCKAAWAWEFPFLFSRNVEKISHKTPNPE